MTIEMHKIGLSIKDISQCAKLSEDKVQKLLANDFNIDDYLDNDDDDEL